MKTGLVAGWLAGLILALLVGWAIWQHAQIANADLRFLACVAPLTIWSLIPVAFWRFFSNESAPAGSAALRNQRRAVLDLLAERGLSRRRGRYSVPFYLVAGPPGVGKSNLLEKAGLTLSEPRTIGSSNWWVGGEAVFVEIALGTAEGTRTVCELLKAVRPLLPVNGTILVLSPTDLTLADKTEHRELAQSVLDSLRTVEDITGRAVPVYLALSKIDLLPGFLEFFDRQEPQERLQQWGFGLPYKSLAQQPTAAEASEAVADGFQRLLAAIRARLVEWLSRETEPVRCTRISSFPAQIASLQTTIQPVLDALLPGNGRAGRGAALRGVYLTSARQEALSIDGLLPELSRRFAMPRVGMIPPDLGLDDEAEGFFIAGLFKNAIFPEAGLAGGTGRSRAAATCRWGAIAVVALICFIGGYHVFRTFDGEVRLAAHGSDLAATLGHLPERAATAPLEQTLASIQHLDAFEADLERAGKDSSSVVGLNGRQQLQAAIADARNRLVQNALTPGLVALLEGDLVNFNAQTETLQRLIVLADRNATIDQPAMTAWLDTIAASLPESLRALFIEESAALVAGKALSVDPRYVNAARRIVAYKESLS